MGVMGLEDDDDDDCDDDIFLVLRVCFLLEVVLLSSLSIFRGEQSENLAVDFLVNGEPGF